MLTGKAGKVGGGGTQISTAGGQAAWETPG